MHCWQHRNRLFGDVYAAENTRGLSNARQTLMQRIGINMFQMQHDMVLIRTNAAPFINFHGHGPAYHITAGQILGCRGIALHKALTFRIGQIAAFTTRTFCDQHACAIDAGRVELHEFHILQRQAGTQGHRIAITGTGMS